MFRLCSLVLGLGLSQLVIGCSGQLVQPGDESGRRDVASIALSTSTPTIGLGQTAGFVVDARSAQGDPVFDASYTWTSSNTSVLELDAEGRGTALALGVAEVTVSANGIESNTASVTVIDNPNLVDPSVRVTPGAVSLNVGQSIELAAQARGIFGELLEEPALVWTATPAGVVTLDESGTATAVGIGEVEIRAAYGTFEGPPARIQVIAEPSYPAVGWQEPSGEHSRVGGVHVVARTHYLATGTTSGANPSAPTGAALFIDGVHATDLEIGIGADYNQVSGTVSIEELSSGEHEMVIEAIVDGATVVSEVRIFEKVDAGEGWENLGDELGGVDDVAEASIAFHDGELMVLSSACQRECNTEAYTWNDESLRWDRLEYARGLWDEERSGEGESEVVTYTPFVDENAGLVTPPKFVGWGWTPTTTRHIEIARDTPRLAAYSMFEARTSFNVDDGLERYWHDCYASQWNDNGGFDGAGGWELLTPSGAAYPSGSDYIYNLPNPNVVLDEELQSSMWQLPESVEANRAEDCASPQLALQDASVVMAYLSSPVPQTAWGLEASRWNGASWDPVGQRLNLGFDSAELTELVVDANGLLVASVGNEEQSQVHRLSPGGVWTPLESGALGVRDLELSDAGGLYGAAERGGDLMVYAGDDARWSQVGDVLDHQPWADVESLTALAHEGELFVAWVEGPAGYRNLYAAQWVGAQASWQLIGGGPLDIAPDNDATGVSLTIDNGGHLVVSYLEPVLQDDLSLSNRVRIRRTQESVMP